MSKNKTPHMAVTEDQLLEWGALVCHEAKKMLCATHEFLDEVREDVAAFRERDPAAKSDAEVVLFYSGFHARLAHRLSHKLHQNGHTLAARAVSQCAKVFTGIEIHPGATIGKGVVIDHGSGVVIGETAEIGDGCTLYQGVTLGGTGKDVGKRHPTVGNRVMIGAGAKVLGPLTIGDHAKIAAGAVVLADVPPDCTAAGVPARVVRQGGKRVVAEELDQIHIPDDVAQKLDTLQAEVGALRAQIAELQQTKGAEQ